MTDGRFSEYRLRIRRGFKAVIRSWYTPAVVSLTMLVALAVWLTPRRTETVATVDGEHVWNAAQAPHTGRFVWKPAEAVVAVEQAVEKLPQFKNASLIRPQLADGGGTLYFTLRRASGTADIYLAELRNGRWQTPKPVKEWNSASADIGPALNADGREAYFFSNRPGGVGGFDLYGSKRTANGWSKPVNLGPKINTAAHEYDPALSPDGTQLYFASNLTPLMQLRNNTAKKPGKGRRWSGTMRAEQGREQFDLYFCVRDSSKTPWSEPTEVFAVNREDSSEGAPAVSPDGLWLYFASDRAGGLGGFDLYRARRKDGRIGRIENLGSTINTTANEMEPAVSPEGFTLFFSSDRDGENEQYSLFRCRAAEVTHRTAWDDANWQAFIAVLTDVWLWVLLTTFLLAAALLAWRRYRGRQSEKTLAARFFLTSLMIHALLLFLAGLVTIGKAIVERREEIIEIAIAPEVTEDHQIAAKQAGLEAFEKLADLKALERKPPPPRERRVAELPNIPNRQQRRAPTIPLRQAKQLPPAHVIRVAGPRRFRQRPLKQLRRQPAKLPRRIALLKPVPLPLPKDAEPGEQPVQKKNEIENRKPLPENFAPRDVKVALNIRPAKARPFGNLPQPSKPKSVQPRRRIAMNRLPRRGVPLKPAVPKNDPENDRKIATTEPSPEKPVDGGKSPDRIHTASSTASVSTPKKFAGPSDPANRRLVIGSFAKKPVIAPPSYDPRVKRLQRRSVQAKRVAEAKGTVSIRRMFSLRQGDIRKQLLPLLGATDESEKAVSRGLLWLAKHQFKDGHWSLNGFDKACQGHAKCKGHGSIATDAAATGFALLPFLARGQTHQKGEYRDVVRSALDWMLKHQKKSGELFTGGAGNSRMYSHAIATIALCEAFGMTNDPKLKDPSRSALKFIIKSQNRGSGGWRYRPNEHGDTSVVGWQVMALKSGEMAGLKIPIRTLQLTKKWLDRVESRGKLAGRYGYTGRGATPAMSAEGLLCRQFLGMERNHPRMRSGADYLLAHIPKPGRLTSYYWYYGTQMMYHMQGRYWKKWGDSTRDMLVKAQVKSGRMSGTWNPSDRWERQAGRIYSTSMKLLVLEVYYRHLPLYRQLNPD